MNREQVRAELAEIAREIRISQDAANDAWNRAHRLAAALKVEDHEPEPEPEPPTRPGPEEPTHNIAVRFMSDTFTVTLPRDARASRATRFWTRHFPVPPVFIEHFRTEAGGVVETVVALHNGCPMGLGAIRIPRVEILTHDGRVIFDEENVCIPPGRPLIAAWDYHDKRGRLAGAGALAKEQFWVHYAAESIGVSRRALGFDDELDARLTDALRQGQPEYAQVGPYRVMWDKPGNEVGGQGVEPDWHHWRAPYAAGYALAAEEMYRVANRTGQCMTDESGAFTWDRETRYTTLSDVTVPGFGWEPQNDAERELQSWRDFDSNHFHRGYRAAVWLAKATRHPFALWFLDLLGNFQVAANLGTAGDERQNRGYWSLERKFDEVAKESTLRGGAQDSGRNGWCKRGGVHSMRFAREWAAISGSEDARLLHRWWGWLFATSADSNGVPYEQPADTIEVDLDLVPMDDGPAAQVFQLQLALFEYEDSGNRARADALRRFLGPSPPYVVDLARSTDKAVGVGKANSAYSITTHGIYPGGADALLRDAKARMKHSIEAGGANPLNNVRGGDLSRIIDADPETYEPENRTR